MLFAAVEFPNDPNVEGRTFWYLCEIPDLREGDRVLAPLGTHNRPKEGVVRKLLAAGEENAPYPVPIIKRILWRL